MPTKHYHCVCFYLSTYWYALDMHLFVGLYSLTDTKEIQINSQTDGHLQSIRNEICFVAPDLGPNCLQRLTLCSQQKSLLAGKEFNTKKLFDTTF